MAQSTLTAEGRYLNPAYRIELYASDEGPKGERMTISAFMPEAFGVNLASTWDSIIKNYLPSGAGSALESTLQAAQAVTGFRTVLDNVSTLAAWTGNSPLEFDVPFRFDAITDAYTDVFMQCYNLMLLASPTLKGGILTPPSGGLDWRTLKAQYQENVSAYNKGNNTDYRPMSLKLGNFAYITGVVLTGVNISFISKFDKDGYPMAADAQVSLRTTMSPTKEDIMNWFLTKSAVYDPLSGRIASIKEAPEMFGKLGRTVKKAIFGD